MCEGFMSVQEVNWFWTDVLVLLQLFDEICLSVCSHRSLRVGAV